MLTFPGFVLGIGGIVTFKKSTLPQVLSEVPLSRIVVETDAPYLTPTPHRGERNDSSYLPLIADFIAQRKGLDRALVARTTTYNAKQLFSL